MARASWLGATLLCAAAAAQTPPAPETQEAQRPWTFLIYAACDNNAEADSNFFGFLDGVRREYADHPGVEIVLCIDRSERYSTNASSLGDDFTDMRLYRVRTGKCERLAGGSEFPEITLDGSYEPDSADPVHVRKFLAYAKAHHPARRYALMLYGHADGRAMCPDEQSGNEMGFAQLTDQVPAELSVDLMALELCNMGGIEIAYQWRPGNGGFSTRYLVAIPNAGPPLDWHRVFARLRENGKAPLVDPASLTPEAFGALIVEEGGNGRRAAAEKNPSHARRLGFEAVACYDLARAAEVKSAVDAWSVQLAKTGARQPMLELRGPGPGGHTLNYVRDRLDEAPYVDLYDLAMRASASERLDAAAREAAAKVATAVDAFIIASYGGHLLPRFQPGKCGVYIVFPDDGIAHADDGRPVRRWEMCRWYTPHQVPGVYGKLAWCRDGAQPGDNAVQSWFELLDCWLDGEDPAGGKNRYAH
jgi:clostripain